jgi:hypothetical protein
MNSQKRSQKIKKESESLKVNLPRKKSRRIKRILEVRLILEVWQIKVSKMIKNSGKTYFSTKICTKEHLNPEGFAEIPIVFVGTARDFQREKIRHWPLFIRNPTKANPTQAPQHSHSSVSASRCILT